jgi:hypothetical protein
LITLSAGENYKVGLSVSTSVLNNFDELIKRGRRGEKEEKGGSERKEMVEFVGREE